MAEAPSPTEPSPRGHLRVAGPILIAAFAVGATLATLPPETTGPGVTCDELHQVAAGKRLVLALRQQGLGFFSPQNIARNFDWSPDDPPVHPPLCYWFLGGSYHLFDPSPDAPGVGSILPGRFAPALALGLMVLLVGLWTTQAEGPLAGSIAAAAVVLVPRVFAHGHLAAMDTLTALFFVAAVLAVAEADARGGGLWRFALAGVVWGLAMLTRIHGMLLFPPVVAWLAWRLRGRMVMPAIVWGASGWATFFLGWPWLWLAPIARLRQFLGTATGRQAVHVFYAGRVWDDHQAPWHYPLVMFLVALPLGLLVLGLAGAWAKRRAATEDPGYLLVIGTLGFMLFLFSWPGVPVYDGVRQFLMVFPLWAVSVGVGARWVVEHRAWKGLSRRVRLAAVILLVVLQGAGLVVYHPCQLSHYSLLVGGLWGAEKLGFEVTYWGDTVREPLLAEAVRRAPEGAILFAPNLAPFQAVGVALSSPSLVENEVVLIGWDRNRADLSPPFRHAVLYNRKADLASVPEALRALEPIVEYRKQGVWLARLVEIPLGLGPARSGTGPSGAGDAELPLDDRER